MKNLKKPLMHIKNIINGSEQITEKQKFSLLISSVAFVHLFLFCVFLSQNIMPLYLFNAASVLCYVVTMRWVRRESYLTVYYITFVEIILHSFISTLCVGWQFGFAQYIIAVVPVGYYICYNMNTKHRKMVIATVNALVATVAFLGCKCLSFFIRPFYTVDSPSVELFLYCFNAICTFVFLIVFSLIYIYEIEVTNAKLRHQNAILDKLANTDPLTGLYNRRSMNLFMEQALHSNSIFSLIMCDIDNFKKVNDTYGHDFGDVVLRDIAQIIKEQVNEHGYVCRWGGEEILILISNAANDKTFQIAESIRRNVEMHMFELNDKWIHCTLTLGIARHKKSNTLEETITAADYNLYCGKRSGKNKVVA